MKKLWKKKEIEQLEPVDQEQPQRKKNNFLKKKLGAKKKEKKPKKEKPPKSQEYIIRKNFTMKVFRWIFWFIIIFIFFKGVKVSLRPDQTNQVQNIIRNFKTELDLERDSNEEILGFTQNFVKEYLTYSREGGESEFKGRLVPYVSKQFNTANAYDFRKDAKAVYIKAYRKEQYSQTQYDVYVLAEILYVDQVLDEETGEKNIVEEYDTSILKVPVSVSSDNKYCIESIPMFVQDQLLDYSYQFTDFYPEGKIENNQIQSSIENFLIAYYSQDQEVINYYLSTDADKAKFLSLNNRYIFQSVDDLKAFQLGNEIVCVLKIKIKDRVNDVVIYQEFNLSCIKEKDRVYIKDINTRGNNIKR